MRPCHVPYCANSLFVQQVYVEINDNYDAKLWLDCEVLLSFVGIFIVLVPI